MDLLIAPEWPDYELIDTGNGKRLERFGEYTLVRPDPQVIWHPHLSPDVWEKADAVFVDQNQQKNKWHFSSPVPPKWLMQYKDLSFWAKPTAFKHTGVFPEQTVQWDWITEKIAKANRPVRMLNLFGYTGIASLVAAAAGAHVTHVDASPPAISWARENQAASNLQDKPIRWMVDDVVKFVQREVRRGVQYDGIIMDPPIYGHGPKGEIWDFGKDFPPLLELCKHTLSESPLFLLVNAYAVTASSLMLKNVLLDYCGEMGGEITSGELALKETSAGRLLSIGIFGRWSI